MKTYHFLFILFFFLPGTFSLSGTAYAQENPHWVAPKSADQITNPLKNDATAAKAGKKIYMQYCFVCHGNSGKGDGIAGMSLNPRPSDLTSAVLQKQSDGALFWKITEGKSPMASYKEILNKQQRWQLVSFIRTLK